MILKTSAFFPSFSQIRLFIFCCLMLAISSAAKAQKPAVYYFGEFTQGKVVLKNGQFAKGRFNYDIANGQMHFMNGETDMIVENLEDIDTIVIGETSFMPYEQRFVEVLKGSKATLLIDKKVFVQERGKTGAMGVATHGSVEAIDVNTRFQRVNGDRNTDLHIYNQEVTNTYLMNVRNSWKSFRGESSFLKLFPKKEQEKVRQQIQTAQTDFSKPEEVLQLLDALQ